MLKQYFDALGNEVTSEVEALVGENEKLKSRIVELENLLKAPRAEKKRKVSSNG